MMDELCTAWETTHKLDLELKDKPEHGNVTVLLQRLNATATRVLQNHAEGDLPAFLQSQCMHITNKMKTLPLPSWSCLKLRKHLPEESVFRRMCFWLPGSWVVLVLPMFVSTIDHIVL